MWAGLLHGQGQRALLVWKAAWVLSYRCGPKQENPGFFASAQGKVNIGLRCQLSSISWNARELSETHWAWMRLGEQGYITSKSQKDESNASLRRSPRAEVSEK